MTERYYIEYDDHNLIGTNLALFIANPYNKLLKIDFFNKIDHSTHKSGITAEPYTSFTLQVYQRNYSIFARNSKKACTKDLK